jgi:hypothetical protein
VFDNTDPEITAPTLPLGSFDPIHDYNAPRLATCMCESKRQPPTMRPKSVECAIATLSLPPIETTARRTRLDSNKGYSTFGKSRESHECCQCCRIELSFPCSWTYSRSHILLVYNRRISVRHCNHSNNNSRTQLQASSELSLPSHF